MSSDNPVDYMQLVTPRGSIELPRSLVKLGADLLMRGWVFRRVGEKLSVTNPDNDPDKPDTLSENEKNEIRKYRDHLLAVVDLVHPQQAV